MLYVYMYICTHTHIDYVWLLCPFMSVQGMSVVFRESTHDELLELLDEDELELELEHELLDDDDEELLELLDDDDEELLELLELLDEDELELELEELLDEDLHT